MQQELKQQSEANQGKVGCVMNDTNPTSIDTHTHSHTHSHTPARTREETKESLPDHSGCVPVPTLEKAISLARSVMNFHDEAFIREWYEDMQMAFWCDEWGKPIRNWGKLLNIWIRNKALFAAKRDPKRVTQIGGGYSGRNTPAQNADNVENEGPSEADLYLRECMARHDAERKGGAR